jgi:hypothetical protein
MHGMATTPLRPSVPLSPLATPDPATTRFAAHSPPPTAPHRRLNYEDMRRHLFPEVDSDDGDMEDDFPVLGGGSEADWGHQIMDTDDDFPLDDFFDEWRPPVDQVSHPTQAPGSTEVSTGLPRVPSPPIVMQLMSLSSGMNVNASITELMSTWESAGLAENHTPDFDNAPEEFFTALEFEEMAEVEMRDTNEVSHETAEISIDELDTECRFPSEVSDSVLDVRRRNFWNSWLRYRHRKPHQQGLYLQNIGVDWPELLKLVGSTQYELRIVDGYSTV